MLKANPDQCADCAGTGSVVCPTCQDERGQEVCADCGGAGDVLCPNCGGSGKRPNRPRVPETSAPESKRTAPKVVIRMPWGEGEIVEVVEVAWPKHQPVLELLQFADGKVALRFGATHKGVPVRGPLVLDEDAIEFLARAVAGKRIGKLLERLGGGKK